MVVVVVVVVGRYSAKRCRVPPVPMKTYGVHICAAPAGIRVPMKPIWTDEARIRLITRHNTDLSLFFAPA